MFEDRTVVDPGAAPPAADPNQTVNLSESRPAAPAFGGVEATQQAMGVTCAVCQTPNPPGERWCRDCGFMLGAVPVDVGELPDPDSLPRLVAASNGGQEYPLQPGPNTVGRENTDLLLVDVQVSRTHARLTVDGVNVTVEDLGSTNGTYVAGRKLGPGEQLALYDGDEVRFGGISLRAVIPGGAARPAALPPASPESLAQRGPAVATLTRAEGTELPLFAGVNPMGRRPDNIVCLTGDPYVSGQHAEIRCEGDTFQLVDLGSTNGTFIDGERLPAGQPRLLADGAVFQLGKTSLTLRRAAEEPAAPAPEDTGEAPEAVPEAVSGESTVRLGPGTGEE